MSKVRKYPIDCNFCNNFISKRHKHDSCCVCRVSYHLKCINLSKKTANINANLNYLYNNWLCISCAAETLPFFSLTATEFTDLFSNPVLKVPLPSADELNNILLDATNCFDSDNDIDDNIVQNNQIDTYFSVQQANALLHSRYSNEDSFSTICVNVRSLINPHNFSKFESLISGLDFQHLIAVNETWEKPHTIGQHKNLNGYVYISNPRVVSRGGGVGMYIKQNLIFAPCPELSLMHEKSFEYLFVTIQFEGRRLICGTVYRPPRSDNLRLTCFFQNLNMVLTEISKTKNKCFIMGDFNFNLLNLLEKNTKMFTDAMFNNSFYPLINKPTRITDSHSSTIDHIWTNIMVTNITSGIIVHCVADHLPVLQVCKFGELKICSVPKTRSFALCNIQKFKSSLETADVSDIFDRTDPDSCFEMLYDLLFDEFDKNFPLTKPAKSNKRCEWYDLELRRLMLKKDRLYKKFLSRHDQASKTRYQKIRNQYFHLISVKKKKFYLQKFKNSHNNMKKTWQCINNLLGRGRSGSAASAFCINGKMTCDPTFIANGFNDHFSNIAVDLVNQLPKSSQHFKEYLTSANPSSIFLYPTVHHLLKSSNILMKHPQSLEQVGMKCLLPP